jgi:hypothetical protein
MRKAGQERDCNKCQTGYSEYTEQDRMRPKHNVMTGKA